MHRKYKHYRLAIIWGNTLGTLCLSQARLAWQVNNLKCSSSRAIKWWRISLSLMCHKVLEIQMHKMMRSRKLRRFKCSILVISILSTLGEFHQVLLLCNWKRLILRILALSSKNEFRSERSLIRKILLKPLMILRSVIRRSRTLKLT